MMKATEKTAMIVGLALGVVLSLGKMVNLPSALLAVWQFAWCGALYILSRSFFKLPKKQKDKKKNIR